jgi:hypothetical protein
MTLVSSFPFKTCARFGRFHSLAQTPHPLEGDSHEEDILRRQAELP